MGRLRDQVPPPKDMTRAELDRYNEQVAEADAIEAERAKPEFKQANRESDPNWQALHGGRSGIAAGPRSMISSGGPTSSTPSPGAPSPDAASSSPATVPTFDGVPGQDAAPEDTAGGLGNTADAMTMIAGQRQYNAGGPPPAVLPEGARYTTWGEGEQGKQNYQDAFYNQPEKIAQAIQAGAEATAEEGKQKADFYKNESKRAANANEIIWARYRQDQAQIDQQLAELQKKTEYYTNDLADRGQFWRNPGNILAAFGAALIGAASGDPTVGVKIINGAINADLHQRKMLADMHLGELRSNVATYRQLAGDRLNGDMLAEAEAKRVAAMELERISNQFQGPKAKANAAALAGNLMQQVAQLRGEVFKRDMWNDVQQVPDWKKKELEKAGKALPGVAWHPVYGQVPAGTPGSTPMASPGATGGSQAAPSGGPATTPAGPAKGAPAAYNGPAAAPTAKTPAVDIEQLSGPQGRKRPGLKNWLSQVDKQYPGLGPAFTKAIINVEQEALNHGPPGSKPYEDYQNKRDADAREKIAEVAKAHIPFAKREAGLRMLHSDLLGFKAAADQFKLNPDDLMSTKTKSIIGSDAYKRMMVMYDANIASAPNEEKDKWRKAKAQVEAAASRLNQLLAGDINAYFKEQSGSATTATELPRLEEYVSGKMGYRDLMNYIENESKTTAGRGKAVLAAAGDPLAAMYYLHQLGTKRPGGLPTDAPRPAK